MSRDVMRKLLPDALIQEFCSIGADLDWAQGSDATQRHLASLGWIIVDDLSMKYGDMPASVVGGEAWTLTINAMHTRWALDVDTSQGAGAARIRHVISLVRDTLGTAPDPIKLDTGKFAARWLLPSGTSVLVEESHLRYLSVDSTEAERFRLERPHKYAQYLDMEEQKQTATTSDDRNASADGRYDAGIQIRREVMGDDFVDAALNRSAGTDGEALQEHVTATVWGSVWTRDGLSRRDRSLLNIGMLVALRATEELRGHIRGALANGLTREEITEAIIHSSGYCGAPAALSAMKVAQQVLEEELGPKA